MTKLQDDLKRKIANILAKAGSTTFAAEADALLDKARAMMEEHQITMFELGDDPVSMLLSNDYKIGSSAEIKYILEAEVYEFYGCQAVWVTGNGRGKTRFYGAESSLETATLMFPFIWKQVLAKSSDPDLDKGGKRKLQKSVALFLCMRMRKISDEAKERMVSYETADTRNALVVLNTAVSDFVKLKHPNLTTRGARTVRITPSGKALAESISLNSQVTGSKAAPTLAIGRN